MYNIWWLSRAPSTRIERKSPLKKKRQKCQGAPASNGKLLNGLKWYYVSVAVMWRKTNKAVVGQCPHICSGPWKNSFSADSENCSSRPHIHSTPWFQSERQDQLIKARIVSPLHQGSASQGKECAYEMRGQDALGTSSFWCSPFSTTVQLVVDARLNYTQR